MSGQTASEPDSCPQRVMSAAFAASVTIPVYLRLRKDCVAVALRGITADTIRDDLLRGRANDLITSRAGYDDEAILQAVERRLAKRSP